MLVRTKLRCWLWGLLPLLAFGVLVVWLTEDRIEQDLTKRSVAALRDAGIDWARPQFSGRDGSIQGEAPSVDERVKALEVVRQVFGVRIVEDRLSLKKIASPFTWSGLYHDGKIKLKGYVPSSQLKSSIAGLAKAKFPTSDIRDDLEVARGVENPQQWFGQVSFSIGLLSRLSSGEVHLVDNRISLKGAAKDEAAYNALTETFLTRLPQGLLTGDISIMPPVVETYFFSAHYDPEAVVLSGVVPSKSEKQALLSAAKAQFPNAKITEKITLGSGAPKGWREALMLSLGELARLEAGVLSVNQFDVKLEGLAADDDTANGVRRTVRSKYPTGYKVSDVITIKEPDVPLASPFDLTLFQAGDVLVMKGTVESDEQRKLFLARVSALFPDLRIDNQLTIARGAPDQFSDAFFSLIALLPKLENGRLEMSDLSIKLSGMSTDQSLVESLSSRPDGLPEGYAFQSAVAYDDSEALAKRAEEERLAAEKAEAERLAREKEAEEEQRAAEAKAREEAEKAEAAKKEAERLAAEKAEADRVEAERLEAEKLEAEKQEAERVAAEKAEEERLKALKEAEDAAAKADETEVTSEEELAEKRKWLTPDETEKRLDSIYKESAAVNAKECQLLMNSIVRGSAIRFGVNSSVIRPDSYEVLKKVESVASRCTNTIIRIEGHTDSDGSEGYNLELSKRRAQAVINHLVKLGVPVERLDAKGNGEKKPVASNATSKGKALNRRIEFVVFEN